MINSFYYLNRSRGPLPKVEEAFTLPIPVELTAKQQQMATASSTNTSQPIPSTNTSINQPIITSSETHSTSLSLSTPTRKNIFIISIIQFTLFF